MSNEFKPGHPVVFWAFMLVLIFAFYSAAVAMITISDCDGQSKSWSVWPPEWECG